MKKIKKCKYICKFCIFHHDDDTCGNYYSDVPNCVTGETDRVFDKCIDRNRDGCCCAYDGDEDLILKNKILLVIKKYQSHRDYGRNESLVDMLCDELEYAIEDSSCSSFYYNSDRGSYYYKYGVDGNYTEDYKKRRDKKEVKKKSWW